MEHRGDFRSTKRSTSRITRRSEVVGQTTRFHPEYLKCIAPFFAAYLKFTEEHKIFVRLIAPEDKEKILLLDYRTRFDSSYKKKLKRKLSGIGFKRCSGLTITTDLNQYTNIISATKAVKKRWDIVLKQLRRELDRFHRMVEHQW